MCNLEEATINAGQNVTLMTCDQQLFRVMVDIKWTDPERWKNLYPRLGGMHWLVSFIGSVGKLMKNSGLDMILKSSFAGVEQMLVGKKFPMNMRALRVVVFELLRGFLNDVESYEEMKERLLELCEKSKLAEHWIQNLVLPVLLMMVFVRAEREGNFLLHIYACHEMMPYFYAAGHWNYVRDGLVYLKTMEKLPNNVLERFLAGEHVIHLQKGYWNGIWSDMAIECTYMKVGKGPS